jgi:transcription antitermination factor NusG
MPWYVLYTKPRNEKKLASTLAARGVVVYCPVKEEVRQWSDRKKKISEPVFRSYIFLQLEDYKLQNAEILQVPGALHFLWWNKKPGIVRDEEITGIKDFLSSYKDVEIDIEVLPGDNLIIHEGPLKDNTGTVLYTRGNKVYLKLNTLGIQMVATIPAQSLRKIQP